MPATPEQIEAAFAAVGILNSVAHRDDDPEAVETTERMFSLLREANRREQAKRLDDIDVFRVPDYPPLS